MKVKLKVSMSGRDENGTYSHRAGEIIEMTDNDGERYIAAGYAEKIEEKKPATRKKSE